MAASWGCFSGVTPPGKPFPQGCCGQFFQSRQFIRREVGQFPVELQYFPHGQGTIPIPFKALDVGKGHRHQIRFPYPGTQRVQPGATPAVPVNVAIQPLACRVVGSPEKPRQLIDPALPPRCLEPFERFAPLLPCLAKRLCRRSLTGRASLFPAGRSRPPAGFRANPTSRAAPPPPRGPAPDRILASNRDTPRPADWRYRR